MLQKATADGTAVSNLLGSAAYTNVHEILSSPGVKTARYCTALQGKH